MSGDHCSNCGRTGIVMLTSTVRIGEGKKAKDIVTVECSACWKKREREEAAWGFENERAVG